MGVGRRRAAVVVAAATGVTAVGGIAATAVTGTQDLTTLTAQQVAQSLVGPGVTISNVAYGGDASAAGTFSGGAASVGYDTGVILSSGRVADAVGPNDADDTTTGFGLPGDADLTTLAGVPTNDAAVLSFDFVPNADTIYFRYVFGSEEYNEYVDSEFNDVFAFFVNGTNCATVPDGLGGTLPVSVNTVNNGTNAALYRDNTAGGLNVEVDGLTVVLTCMAPVNANVTNSMKLAIADGSDFILDSAVFLEQGSLSTTPPGDSGKVTGGGRLDLADGAVTLGTSVIQDEQGLRGNLQVNDHRIGARFHGYSVDSFSVSGNTATWTGDGRLNGEDGYTFAATVVDNRNGNAARKGAPDTVSIVILDGAGQEVWSLDGPVDLLRGNVVVH